MGGFELDDKAVLLGQTEVEDASGTYGSGDGPSNLTAALHGLAWTQFKSRKIPVVKPREEGLVARRAGQALVVTGYTTEWSGAVELEEITILDADSAGRPNVNGIIMSSAWDAGVHASAGTNTITYDDETFPESLDSLELACYKYVSDKARARYDITGAICDTQITFEPQKPILFEAINGLALTHSDAVAVASVFNPVPSYTQGAKVPFNGGTLVLQALGGGTTYAGPIRKVMIRSVSNPFNVPDGNFASGIGRAYCNPFAHAEMDLLIDLNKAASLNANTIWAAGTVLDYQWSVPGPVTATNIFSGRFYGTIDSVEKSRGPGGETLALVKCKLMWTGGAGALGSALQLVWTSAVE